VGFLWRAVAFWRIHRAHSSCRERLVDLHRLLEDFRERRALAGWQYAT